MAHSRSNTPRQRKSWTGAGVNQNAFTASGTVKMGGVDFDEPGTVLRCLGQIVVSAVPTLVEDDQAVMFFGLAVVSTDASDAGSGSMPDPGVEFDFPWLWWKSSGILVTAATADVGSQVSGERINFDSRAMRKVKPRESLVIIAQYVDLVGTSPITVGISGMRVLVGT